MKVVVVKNIQSKPNPHGVDARNLSDTEMAQVVHITLQPGESLKKHVTPVDVVFYVLEGQGVVEIGEERKEVGMDTLIESPARIPHRWINESKGLVRILVIKTPRPKETTKSALKDDLCLLKKTKPWFVASSWKDPPKETLSPLMICWPRTSPCTSHCPPGRASLA